MRVSAILSFGAGTTTCFIGRTGTRSDVVIKPADDWLTTALGSCIMAPSGVTLGLRGLTFDGRNTTGPIACHIEAYSSTMYTQSVDFVYGTNPNPEYGGGSMYLADTVALFSDTRFMSNRVVPNVFGGGAISLMFNTGAATNFNNMSLNGVSGICSMHEVFVLFCFVLCDF